MNTIRSGKHMTVIWALILLAGYLGYQFYQRWHNAETLRELTLEAAIPTVALTSATLGEPNESITLPGTVDAWYQAPIYAQVSGYVKMWYKDYGAHVKKGDKLAEIAAPALDAQFAQAKADLEAQQAKYNLAVVTAKRYLAMRESHAVSEQAISVQQANMLAEKAQVNAAKHNVSNFEAKMRFKTIVAPYDGIVTRRNINVGDYINNEGYISSSSATDGSATMSDLFQVADIHKMRLFISVPSPFARFLKPSMTADVTVPQFPNRHFTAEFLTTANGIDPNTRTVVAEFTIENKDHVLWPGSYATVRIQAPVDQNVMSIPSSAMVFDDKGTQVATVTEDNRIHFKPITVSKILDATVEVMEGVTASDRIVNNPSAALLEGDEVRIVTPAPGYDNSQTEEKKDHGEAANQAVVDHG
ncbi:efflux RND transporter periplasmic adaptor subunit [Methylomonas methanica]|uniref:Efflux transporter, RND family, MFP subunit n=1 Tax=Methylomonas methanica (strain DSM 25384 / MC09) TaxID=857087 RepID=G0A1M0_METMM|nr:efflux RND transporter periplasmic adaptor subunit [Methylomonas methanica]AEG00081.1 efflux transporter, RND family, MFP subunit [Methylomonas methanica MC09]